MNRLITIMALGLVFAMAPLQAAPGSAFLEARFQSSLNQMVQNVRQAPDASAKREILEHFVEHMSQGLQKAEGMQSLSEADKAGLHAVSAKFHAFDSELKGGEGFDRVADADLDQFAGYIQQGMEQAPVGGGIYISGGVLVLLLALILILT